MTTRGLLAQAATLLVLAISLQLTSGYSFIGNRITDLEGDGASFIEDSTHWIMNGASPSPSNPIHSVCGSTYLLGGDGITNKEVVFKKNYTDLPPHDVIYFSFYASLIDEWHRNTSFALIFDKQSFSVGLFGLEYSTDFTGFSCGNSGDKDLDRVKLYGKAKHTGDTLTFAVQTMTHTDPSKRAFGFREVTLVFRNHTKEEKYLPREAEMCALASIPLKMNECECLEGEYKSPVDGSCQSCDSQCQSCLGPSPLQCLECKSSAFFNGTQCMACHSSCATCFGSAANQCLSCPSNYFMFEGNSCVDSCNAPLVSTTVGSVNYCSFPCSTDEFLYSDGSCAPACPATYNSITWSSRKFCSFYCPIGQYYVPPSGAVSGGCLNSCPSGFFTEPTARYCSSCQDSLCDVCVDNGATCQKCKPGAILDSDGVCKPCTSMSVSYYKTLDSGYRYMFELYPAACALSAFTVQSDLMGIVDSDDNSFPPYHFRVSPQDTNPYLVDLILDGSVLEKKNINLQLRHLNGTMIVPKKLVASETLQEVALYTSSAETVVTSAVAASFAAAVALGSTAAIWSIISFQQFIGYFAFINVAFPLQVQMFFSLLGSSTWDFLPNPLQAISQPFYDSLARSGEFSEPENQPPHKFVENDMTSAFIENGGGILVTNIALLGLLLLVGFVKRIERLKKNGILRAVKNALRWNVIARTYLENCIPLLLAVFLQLRSLNFDHLYMVFGSTLSFFSLIYCATIFVLLSKVLYKSSVSELKKEATQKKFGTLSEGIALEGPSSKYYHMIILVRGILLAFLVVFLEDMPVAQIVPLILYNAYLVYYLFKEANFEDRNLNMINRAKEILILVAETLILGLMFEGGTEQHYNTLGWLIVSCFVTALLVELVYMIWLQIKGLPEIKKKIVALWNLIRNWFKNKEARQRQRDRRNRNRRVSPQKCEEDTVMMELDIKEKVEMSAFYTEKSFNLK